MQATEDGPAVTIPVQTEPRCPGCGGAQVHYHAGYAFCSVPGAVPVWEETAWCEDCGWSEEQADGQPVGGAVDKFLTASPQPLDDDDLIPPF